MSFNASTGFLAVACVVTVLLGSCSKSDEKKATKDQPTSLLDIARRAGGGMTLEEEVTDIKKMIEAAGFRTKVYEPFPGQQIGWKARILVYESKNGKPPGGVVYINKKGNKLSPGWHWYFPDMVPDSVVAVELNDDGLWDLSLMDGKRVVSFLQEETFSLTAGERTDWLAMNGTSSALVSASDALWKAFDGDTTTAWRSPLGDNSTAYVEFASPFGITDGVLTVRTLEGGQPKECTLYADGSQIQQFELEARAASQMIQLDRRIVGAKQVRLEFNSTHGDAPDVEIGELGLR